MKNVTITLPEALVVRARVWTGPGLPGASKGLMAREEIYAEREEERRPSQDLGAEE